MRKTQLVIARYKESVEWLRPYTDLYDIFVYNKSGQHVGLPGATVVELENVGRESHTYLHHIIAHYDDLPEWTIFSQANPFDHAPNLPRILKKSTPEGWWQENIKEFPKSAIKQDGFMGLGYNWSFDPDYDDWPNRSETMRFLWAWAGVQEEFPDYFPISYGAIFAVHRDNIHLRSKFFYEELYKFHYDIFVMPWSMEYLWRCLFSKNDERKTPLKLLL